jgi:hypothetical protein
MEQIPKEIREAMKERDRLAAKVSRAEAEWLAAQFRLGKQVELINRLWLEHRKRLGRKAKGEL